MLAADEVKVYKDAYEREDALIKEFNDLKNSKFSDLTVEQNERYNKLKDYVKYADNRILSNSAKQKLEQKVSSFTKDSDFLTESYRERERAGRKFAVDLDSVDEKYRQTYKDAMDSGVFTNKRSVHEAIDYFARLSADKGVKFNFTSEKKLIQEAINKLSSADQQTVKAALDGGLLNNLGEKKLQGFIEKFATNKDGSIDAAKVELLKAFAEDAKFAVNVNGWYNPKDGSITYKAGSAKGWRSTVGHELTHTLEKSKHYKAFRDAIQEYSKKKGDYKTRLEGIKELYAEKDWDYELTADLGGDYVLTDAEFATHLFQSDRNVFQKVFDEIKHLYNLATAGSQEARLLETAKHNFEKAYRENIKNPADGRVKYSTQKSNNGVLSLIAKVKAGNYKANEKVYFDNVPDEIAKKIKEITGVDTTGFKVAIEARQIDHILKDHGENGKADRSMADDNDIAKMEYAIHNADNLTYGGKTQAYSYMKDGFNRTADTVLYEKYIGEKSYYVVQAVADTKAKTLYIVSAYIGNSKTQKGASQLIDEKIPNATPESGSVVAPIKSISQNEPGVNGISENSDKKLSLDADNRYSLSDSEGRNLSPAVQNRFKNSKVVDEDGNLYSSRKYAFVNALFPLSSTTVRRMYFAFSLILKEAAVSGSFSANLMAALILSVERNIRSQGEQVM